MPRAKLRVSFPEEVWIGRLSRNHPDANLRILAATPSGAIGVALVEINADSPESVVSEMGDFDEVTELELLEEQPEYCLVQFETTLPLVLDAAQEAGVPISLPLSIRAGEGYWEVTASRDRLSDLGSQLETFGLRFSVESIYQEVETAEVLSDNQWALIQMALQMGYYDVPRACTQYELAEESGLARSTCSETLHRAESKIIQQFAETETPAVQTADL